MMEAEPQRQVNISSRMEDTIRHMLKTPRGTWSLSDIGKALDVGSGTIHPILKTMHAAGWLDVTIEPRRLGSAGPLRKLYKFTPGTAVMLRKAIR